MRRATRLVLALSLALAPRCWAVDTPTVRPLDPGTEEAPAPAQSDPARRLPATVAVCHEPATQKCWTAPRGEDCARDAGQVFRVVIGSADGPDALAALTQCRSTPPPAR